MAVVDLHKDPKTAKLTTFTIDVVKQTMEERDVVEVDLTKVQATERTHKYFALVYEDKLRFFSAINLKKQQTLTKLTNYDISILDDLVITRDGNAEFVVHNIDGGI